MSGRRALPTISLTDAQLGVGASFGNSAIWVNTKSTGALERVFLNALAQSLIGTISLRYGAFGLPLSTVRNADRSAQGCIAVRPDGDSRRVDIHPAYQRVSFVLGGVVEVKETTFVPLGNAPSGYDDPPLAYIVTELINRSDVAHQIRVVGSARLRGSMEPDVRVRFDAATHALVAFNASQPNAVRIFGVSEPSSRFEAGFDFGRIYDPTHVNALNNLIVDGGDVIGQLQLDVLLEPQQSRTMCFTACAVAEGERFALETYAASPGHERALEQTIAHLEDVLAYNEVLTPEPLINQGALWSKVNMRRVMASYPHGVAFTNDPGNYANVVVRDSAWFVYGNDHFMPAFSRQLLESVGSRQYANGKLPEYYNAVTGEVYDDGLNINDDTPLYILAVNHHFRSTGDMEWLRGVYPRVAAAAIYIISQVDARGLVFCSARDPRGNVWASASWRNIIDRYSINGAVTEINAECVAALRAAAHLADNLKRSDDHSQRFAEASRGIQDAMNKHLINPENGLYYLNIDVDGNVHTDVTGDEIFPVMFRACSEDTGFRVISRLNAPDFWTSAGLRTVSRDDPLFDPSNYAGLMGGVWPGLTWWYAFAAARYHPNFMVRALRSSFAHYAVDPKKNNTVPGQFSEWFDGESLTNKGMRLSPWEPPRFLWAAIEGVCGFMVAPGEPSVNPIIPSHWTWVGARRLPYHGAFVSYFGIRQRSGRLSIYSTTHLKSNFEVSIFERDVTDQVHVFSDRASVIALASENETILLVGNTATETVAVPIDIQPLIDASKRYTLRTYNSERQSWEQPYSLDLGASGAIAVSIEAGGFRLLQLSTKLAAEGSTATR
ncbi:MAG: amylo-alpha-1,6-glucosidase [Candidatus Baltobacteraceae bacterium]